MLELLYQSLQQAKSNSPLLCSHSIHRLIDFLILKISGPVIINASYNNYITIMVIIIIIIYH
jgi:hypothetical protein